MELPRPSAVTVSIDDAGLKNSLQALPLEVLHNLQYQHKWSDLRLHRVSAASHSQLLDLGSAQAAGVLLQQNVAQVLISGLPPRHMYVHPDLLNHLVQNSVKENTLPLQREWVMPASIGEKWSLKRFSGVFDCLPTRPPISVGEDFQHQDSKRIFLGMLGHNGAGGDGTIVYYIMQEGEVKPRQN